MRKKSSFARPFSVELRLICLTFTRKTEFSADVDPALHEPMVFQPPAPTRAKVGATADIQAGCGATRGRP